MCFSATASFVGGTLLTSIGAMTILKNKEKSQRLFASIPIVFGIQQISEGFVWIGLRSQEHDLTLKVATYIFLITAVVIWPTMVPLSMLFMEKIKSRRIVLCVLLVVGIAVSLFYGIGAFFFNVTAQISSFHILYSVESPPPIAGIASIAYLVATIPSLFVSSKKRIYQFGIIVGIAYAITQYFYMEFLISVWCFFAAIASIIIYWILREQSSEKGFSRNKIAVSAE